jgi:hypothetical protein
MKRNMKSRNRAPYVDLPEAVRVVVRLMPGGEALAEKMTDRWITGPSRYWDAGLTANESAGSPANEPKPDYRDDDALMRSLYGQDWRPMRPRVIDAYRKAVDVLEQVLPSGRVAGFGFLASAHEKGQRPIEPHEWASRELDIRHKRLVAPAGKSPETRPPILDVLVCFEDLQRECAAVIEAEAQTSSAPNLESVLLDARRENPSLTQAEAEKMARGLGVKESREKIRERWKALGGSSKPGPKGPRKKRATPAA